MSYCSIKFEDGKNKFTSIFKSESLESTFNIEFLKFIKQILSKVAKQQQNWYFESKVFVIKFSKEFYKSLKALKLLNCVVSSQQGK